MKKIQRSIIIPDRLFFHLWKESLSSPLNKQEYIRKFLSPLSEDYINMYKKYGLKEDKATYLLSSIYENSHKSFKQILEEAGLKNAQVSNIYCIPIRTVENWIKADNCFAYIKLMILRDFFILDLGKYVHLESEYLKADKKTKTYETHNVSSKVIEDEIEIEDMEEDDFENELDEILRKIHHKDEQVNVQKAYENRRNILAETDYFAERMKKKRTWE